MKKKRKKKWTMELNICFFCVFGEKYCRQQQKNKNNRKCETYLLHACIGAHSIFYLGSWYQDKNTAVELVEHGKNQQETECVMVYTRTLMSNMGIGYKNYVYRKLFQTLTIFQVVLLWHYERQPVLGVFPHNNSVSKIARCSLSFR